MTHPNMRTRTDRFVPLEQRFWANVDKRGPDECWPWTGSASNRYGQIRVDGRTRKATHVAIYLATGEWPPVGMCACHRCDNPPCVNPAHLWVGTISENVRDCFAKGRKKVVMPKGRLFTTGESHPRSKLTEDQVRAIRSSGQTPSELSRLYGVSEETVRLIRNRKRWGHLPDEQPSASPMQALQRLGQEFDAAAANEEG